MAPAGNFESLQAALDNGADSIYFGVEQLNMRARASINFTLDDLEEIQKRSGSIMVVITLRRKKSIG
jgi:putative protease